MDAMAGGVVLGRHIGVKLPSSFVGGPRWHNQLYHDDMAITRALGKPDLFITMTCNPKWPEIVAALPHGQNAASRPDIVDRVFAMKLAHFIKRLKVTHDRASFPLLRNDLQARVIVCSTVRACFFSFASELPSLHRGLSRHHHYMIDP